MLGCDVHMYCEALYKIDKKSVWVNVDNWRYNPYYDDKDPDDNEFDCEGIYYGRDYSLFNVLARVRGDGESIDKTMGEPRGLPKDVSKIVKKLSDDIDTDGHSHSYFTLKELIDFNKKPNIIKYSGYMTKKDAKKLDEERIPPTSWFEMGGLMGRTYVHRNWEHQYDGLEPIIKALTDRLRNVFTLDEEDKITKELSNIRIVFWFDN